MNSRIRQNETLKNLACWVIVVFISILWMGTSRAESSLDSSNTIPNSIPHILTPEMLRMPRAQMAFTDDQLRLFNGRGSVYVQEYTLTGLHNILFLPINCPDYNFNLDFLDKKSGTLIQDDVADMWKDYLNHGKSFDPLGSNFRPNSPTLLVSQDEIWQPNLYHRTGTFHKIYNGRWVSFAIETKSSVSARLDEIYLEVKITNRRNEPLELTLLPKQDATRLAKETAEGSAVVKKHDPFQLESEQARISLVSTLTQRTEKGWDWTIPPSGSATATFAFLLQSARDKAPDLYQNDIPDRMKQADQDTRTRLRWAADRLPVVTSNYPKLQEFYNRCLLSVMECRWERDEFNLNPFWAVGTWIFTITWDNSFSANVLSMLDPESMREAIIIPFKEGKMKRTYISPRGAEGDILYLQEPFALLMMLNAYLKQTGDVAFLDHKLEGLTIYEWMKKWGIVLHDEYGRPEDGLIDVGLNTEKIVEIRTDGYCNVVPVMNGLTVWLYQHLASWGKERKDPEAEKFERYAEQLSGSFHSKLWNEKAGWFDNLFPDGSRELVYSYHLYDLLGTTVLTNAERERVISQIKEGEFLGKFGMYSISKKDRIHWDLIDADWGGGGQYPGMPLQIALSLYRTGHAELGWDILKRFMNYIDYFPYIPQNPRTDRAEQDMSSMPLEISSGAGIEAILFGIFGLNPQVDGTLEISPSYHHEYGNAVMRDYHFRGHFYDVEMQYNSFKVLRDGTVLGEYPYGRKMTIAKSGGVF